MNKEFLINFLFCGTA